MIRLRYVAPLLLLASVPAPAQAADTVLAPAANTAGITAYGGHVVLSRRDPSTNRWALVRWHAGVVDVLPVPERSVPFDADAGTDAQGQPVVVYSRCSQDPRSLSGSPGGIDFGAGPSPDWQTAASATAARCATTPASISSTSARSAPRMRGG